MIAGLWGTGPCGSLLPALILCVMLVGCARNPPPSASTYDPNEAKEIIDTQTHCFTGEAAKPKYKSVDLNTAALAVQASCVVETQRLKAFKARNTMDNVPDFEARWRQEEADDLQYIRQVLAVVRTSK